MTFGDNIVTLSFHYPLLPHNPSFRLSIPPVPSSLFLCTISSDSLHASVLVLHSRIRVVKASMDILVKFRMKSRGLVHSEHPSDETLTCR